MCRLVGTNEMMQPCLIYLQVISLVVLTAGDWRFLPRGELQQAVRPGLSAGEWHGGTKEMACRQIRQGCIISLVVREHALSSTQACFM